MARLHTSVNVLIIQSSLEAIKKGLNDINKERTKLLYNQRRHP
jgi:hypothetical protein